MGRKQTPEWIIHKENSPKENHIKSDNPFLIVGAGPSFQRDIDKISKFPGKIIAVDANFKECIDAGIKLDYAMTRESLKARYLKAMFPTECLDKFEGTVIGSTVTPPAIIEYFRVEKQEFAISKVDESRLTNVGIFGVVFAHDQLKADKLFILGMEHEGEKYDRMVYGTWRGDFWWYVKKWPVPTVINLCDGGALYYKEFIIDTTLDKLKIVRTRDHNTG